MPGFTGRTSVILALDDTALNLAVVKAALGRAVVTGPHDGDADVTPSRQSARRAAGDRPTGYSRPKLSKRQTHREMGTQSHGPPLRRQPGYRRNRGALVRSLDLCTTSPERP